MTIQEQWNNAVPIKEFSYYGDIEWLLANKIIGVKEFENLKILLNTDFEFASAMIEGLFIIE